MDPDQCKDDLMREMHNWQFVEDRIPYCATIGIPGFGKSGKRCAWTPMKKLTDWKPEPRWSIGSASKIIGASEGRKERS
ncbi:MAG: hypothetical protein WD425_07950 [Nitrospirales bacterium]